ncbi:hypothetical protein ABZ848_47780 [Streptomyces sp. NPDC047081]|uniref:hypothetical protein n=1 Tax=Streptomyces sp. NPDC047081 TaxID=3154706 RepID=UPI0033D2EC78
MTNVVVAPPVWERTRGTVLDAPAVLLEGHNERDRGSVNMIVHCAHALAGPARAISRGDSGDDPREAEVRPCSHDKGIVQRLRKPTRSRRYQAHRGSARPHA